MGKFRFSANHLLGLLCASALAFPSLASAGTVSVEVSPTTGYTSTTSKTFAPPARSSTSAIQTYKPTLGPLSGGGAYQTMQSGITITGIKQESQTLASTVSSRLRATAGAMKNGLGRCFTSFRCNAALMVGSAGIESFIDSIGWLIDEGGTITMLPSDPLYKPPLSGSYNASDNYSGGPVTGFPSAKAACAVTSGCVMQGRCKPDQWTEIQFRCCAPDLSTCGGLASRVGPLSCPSGSTLTPAGCVIDGQNLPVSEKDIQDAVNTSYNPHPSDLPFLASGGLDFSGEGVDIEIVDIPSVTGINSPDYIEYSDGTAKGTYSEYEFTWGAPSKQPEISVNERTVETTYSSTGEPTGTTTTTSSSSGSPANNPPEIPTDCDFMPTVCRFIDWFTEPDSELAQDADFSQLIDDVDIERDFSVGSSTASCPAPFVIPLKWVPSVEVSLQPFCDFADLLRPVLLALAYLVSGAIILRT